MTEKGIILFVCEHGAAKSVIAATYFNKLAAEKGLDLRGVARGTDPQPELSAKALAGLQEDGLEPPESVPQKLLAADVQSARQIVAFCDLPLEYQDENLVDHWNNVPAVSEDYANARDAILQHVTQLVNEIMT